MSRSLLIFVSVCLALAVGEQARYDNYRVYKVIANDIDQLAALKDLDGSTDSMIFLDGVHALSKGVHVVVAPHKVPDFVNILSTKGITHELVEEDAQSRLDSVDLGISGRARSGYGWTSYHTLEENYEWLRSLAKAYPKVVSLIVGGKSYEGRQILGIKISHKSGNKGIFIEGGIHAREWIAPATVTYIINQLLTSTSPQIKNIAINNDWYIFPHANPDGYAYTWTNDRMWRKTRRPYGSCFGADPNRNWNFHWNEVGSSNNACSDTYAGPSAASEIEVKTLSSYISSLKGKIHLYISFHAYSQYLLYPYGHTNQLPPNVADLKTVYNAAVDAMNKRYGTKYTGGNIYDAIYPASGSSIDWAYSNVNTKLAYCYELRPSSNNIWYGFQLPASQIIATGEETIDSIVAMVGKAKQLKYL
ncbi:zinc carboxypeptidase A 1-like [Episyrphus balteatus]|uniref:zinc carboxypeptidase A 1-like n=1 Tax=Episyrphus balteatus TaxID=286459 RepID=UPI002485E5AB|nr:zinc carboxypeptidase A 1-like [Episyrphus balteatus]